MQACFLFSSPYRQEPRFSPTPSFLTPGWRLALSHLTQAAALWQAQPQLGKGNARETQFLLHFAIKVKDSDRQPPASALQVPGSDHQNSWCYCSSPPCWFITDGERHCVSLQYHKNTLDEAAVSSFCWPSTCGAISLLVRAHRSHCCSTGHCNGRGQEQEPVLVGAQVDFCPEPPACQAFLSPACRDECPTWTQPQPGACPWVCCCCCSRSHNTGTSRSAWLGAWPLTRWPGLFLWEWETLPRYPVGQAALSTGSFSSGHGPGWCLTGRSSFHSSQRQHSGCAAAGRAATPSRTGSQSAWTSPPSRWQKRRTPSAGGCWGGCTAAACTPPRWAWWRWHSGTWCPAWTPGGWCFSLSSNRDSGPRSSCGSSGWSRTRLQWYLRMQGQRSRGAQGGGIRERKAEDSCLVAHLHRFPLPTEENLAQTQWLSTCPCSCWQRLQEQ